MSGNLAAAHINTYVQKAQLAASGFIELLLYFWHYQSAGKMQQNTVCAGILSGTDSYVVIKLNE
ncbi:MAG TPA: hypothetical protein VIH66_03240, partial [Gammaproteobacteria bacterium]